jgi:hypothetical protein
MHGGASGGSHCCQGGQERTRQSGLASHGKAQTCRSRSRALPKKSGVFGVDEPVSVMDDPMRTTALHSHPCSANVSMQVRRLGR